MPSHTPAATAALWQKLVARGPLRRSAAAGTCHALRAVFYTEDDWLRLATKLAANASPCAQYYISIPPLAADKTAFRSDQPWRIRALGPNFHAVAEINYTGWNNWVTANNSTFYDAGVQARQRMAAAGFDVAAGDTWAVNEFSSAVRAGTNVARQKVRDLARGLYGADALKGIVFDIGVDQSTSNLAPYKVALQNWYQDAGFWQDMSAYVGDWSQELYGDVRAEAVAGAPAATRISYLNDFLDHQLTLAEAAPPSAAAARSFLEASDDPLANAAWQWNSGFGFTNVPVDQMEDFVSAQVAALRTTRSRFGFAWAPRMADGSAWTSQFTADTGTLLDRLAAAIHDSDATPLGACGTSWCTAALTGAAFTDAWKTFATWSPTTLSFSSAPVSASVGSASSPVTVALQTDGIAQAAFAATAVTFASSSARGAFATSASGPWSPTLTVTIPAGSSSASVYYEDGTAGAPTLSASAPGLAASQVETVVATPPPAPAPAPIPSPTPPPSGGGGSGGLPPDLHVALTSDSANVPATGSQLIYRVAATTGNVGSASSVRLVLSVPSGYTVTKTYSDRGAGCATSGTTVTCDLGWISPAVGTNVIVWGTTSTAAELDATATVTSVVEPEANPADNAATLKLLPATGTSPATAAVRLVRVPKIARHGRRLQVAAPAWTPAATAISYQWQRCSRTCLSVRGATKKTFTVARPGRVRVVARATVAGHVLVATSATVAIR